MEHRSLKEVVVFRRQQVVHIYNIIEHGRRFYRSLVYTSDSRWSLADLIPVHPTPTSWAVYDRWAAAQTYSPPRHTLESHGKHPKSSSMPSAHNASAAHDKLYQLLGTKPGDPLHAAASLPHYSLCITRNWSSRVDRVQKYIPRQYLQGLIPHTLLNDYVFWAETDDSLTAFLRPHARGRLQTPTILRVQLIKDQYGDEAGARIMRVPLGKYTSEEGEVEELKTDLTTEVKSSLQQAAIQSHQADQEAEHSRAEALRKGSRTVPTRATNPSQVHSATSSTDGDASSGRLYLLNLLYSPDNSPLAALADWIVRIEDLSHCLCWTRTPLPVNASASVGVSVSVDVIELPRLQLSFNVRLDPTTNQYKLYSQDHHGYFVSNTRDAKLLKLLEGLPHAILLEHQDGDLAVLLLATRIRRLKNRNEQYSTELLAVRKDQKWWNKMKVRHFLYPVHLSHTFLFTPSLASAVYLLILRFLTRQYAEVFQLADSCVSDSALTPEESQIIGELHLLADDFAPDAHACRLKISLVTQDSAMPTLTWDTLNEFRSYLCKRQYVSAGCRLSGYEEYNILMSLQDRLHQYPYLFNRLNYLGSILNGQGIAPAMLPYNILQPLSQFAGAYDRIVDKTALTGDSGFLSSLTNVSYKKPKDLKGLEAAQNLHRWLESGLRLKGGKDDLGFLFIYELMTGTCKVKLCEGDSGYELGCLMLRLLDVQSDYIASHNQNIMMSILRVLALNPSLAADPSCPKVDTKRNFGMTTLFKGSDNMFSRLLNAFTPFIQQKEREYASKGVPLVWSCTDFGVMRNPPTSISVPVPPTPNEWEKMQARKSTITHRTAMAPTTPNGTTEVDEKKAEEEKQETIKDLGPLGPSASASVSSSSPLGDSAASSSPSSPFPPKSPSPFDQSREPPPAYPRDLIVPRIQNISCARFELPLETPAVIRSEDRLDSFTTGDLKAFSSGPLRVLPMSEYVALRDRSGRGLDNISPKMPFDLTAHPIARTYNGKNVLDRVSEDVRQYADQQNEAYEAELLFFLEADVMSWTRHEEGNEKKAMDQLKRLEGLLEDLHRQDHQKMASLIVDIMRTVNTVTASTSSASTSSAANSNSASSPTKSLASTVTNVFASAATAAASAVSSSSSSSNVVANISAAIDAAMGTNTSTSPNAAQADGMTRARLTYSLARYGGVEGTLTFEFLVGLLLNPNPQFELQLLNPLLSASQISAVLRATVQVLFLGNRLGHVRRCRAQLHELHQACETLHDKIALTSIDIASPATIKSHVHDVVLKSEKLAGLLVSRRHFMEISTSETVQVLPDGTNVPIGPRLVFDPRFLVFEFTYNLLLRKSQVELVQSIVYSGTGSNRPSVAHQMLMGGGKVSTGCLRSATMTISTVIVSHLIFLIFSLCFCSLPSCF